MTYTTWADPANLTQQVRVEVARLLARQVGMLLLV